MKQIYNFEQAQPPMLNENMLLMEIERRKLRLQTALLAFSSALMLSAMILLGIFTCERYPGIAFSCFVYAIISATGGSILSVVFTRKGGISV